MHQTKHLHPEWGILAPPQSFVRALRIVLITTAVSATTCAGVILSLVDRVPDQKPQVARTFAAPMDMASAAATQFASTLLLSAPVRQQSVPESEPTKVASSVVARIKPVADLRRVEKKANKKHHAGARYASRGRQFTSLMDDWYHAVGL
jgi:hypothetical protein